MTILVLIGKILKTKITMSCGLFLVGLLGSLIIGFYTGRVTKNVKCQEIKIGVVDSSYNIHQNDTLSDIIKPNDVKAEKKVVKVSKENKIPINDTTTSDTPFVVDTQYGYYVEKTYDNGTYLRATIRSKEFPKVKPIDINGDIIYKPKNDTIKIFKVKDTIIKQQSKWYTGIGTSINIGYDINSFNGNFDPIKDLRIQVSVGFQFGRRIKI